MQFLVEGGTMPFHFRVVRPRLTVSPTVAALRADDDSRSDFSYTAADSATRVRSPISM